MKTIKEILNEFEIDFVWNDMFYGKTPDGGHSPIIPREIKDFFRTQITELLEGIKKDLDEIKEWPEPSPDAGKGGLGALWTAGLLEQYKHDSKKHVEQIQEINEKIKEIME